MKLTRRAASRSFDSPLEGGVVGGDRGFNSCSDHQAGGLSLDPSLTLRSPGHACKKSSGLPPTSGDFEANKYFFLSVLNVACLRTSWLC